MTTLWHARTRVGQTFSRRLSISTEGENCLSRMACTVAAGRVDRVAGDPDQADGDPAAKANIDVETGPAPARLVIAGIGRTISLDAVA